MNSKEKKYVTINLYGSDIINIKYGGSQCYNLIQ